MKQKGFATIFGLCLVLIVAVIIKGIQDAEANHAREVLNFEFEQALQSAADSGIVETAEKIKLAGKNAETTSPYYLPYKNNERTVKKLFPTITKSFEHGEQMIQITVEVRGERGKIYIGSKANLGVYLMSRATINSDIWGEKIYRRSYAYVLSKQDGDNEYVFNDDTTLYFMELP